MYEIEKEESLVSLKSTFMWELSQLIDVVAEFESYDLLYDLRSAVNDVVDIALEDSIKEV